MESVSLKQVWIFSEIYYETRPVLTGFKTVVQDSVQDFMKMGISAKYLYYVFA